MVFQHGSHKSVVLGRINARAAAIVETGATDEELHDPTDINPNEDQEIAFARKLAAEWNTGNAIAPYHLLGVSALYASDAV